MRHPIALLSATFLAILSVNAGLISRARTNITGAAYSMTNDPSGNNIVIHTIATNGTLQFAGVVPTGGKGEHGAETPGPDALFSQAPMIVSGQHLFAVNPASNSVSMFSINPNDPTQLKMVGKPVNSGGEFPLSIAIHPKSGNIYVLNGGAVSGVKRFIVNPSSGLQPTGTFHALHVNTTTPPAGPANTLSRVLFSSDGTKLRVSFKGNPNALGFLATYQVNNDGSLSSNFTKTTPPSIADGGIQFGMTNVNGAQDAVIVADVALGVTVYDFSKPQTRFLPLTIPGQGATCWVEFSQTTDSYFLSDLANKNIFQVKVDSNTLKPTLVKTINLAANDSPIEIAIAKINVQEYLYVLTPSIGSINVFAIKSGNNTHLIQNFLFGDLVRQSGAALDNSNLEGMAIFLTGAGPHPFQSPA